MQLELATNGKPPTRISKLTGGKRASLAPYIQVSSGRSYWPSVGSRDNAQHWM